MKIEEIARVCHEVNRGVCEAAGDQSQLPWEEAPGWQRSSCVDGVRFQIANPSAPASASHENWMRVKLAEGWKKGDVKDPAKKRHPCLVAYDDLPFDQRVKDHIFKAVVAALT